MVEEGPYEILPYAEIDKLKKEIEDLKKKSASSEEVLDAVNRQTKIIESMLNLFESAAAGMKKEDEGHLGKKLNKVIDQNETIAESILSLVDMINELEAKESYISEKPQPIAPEPIPRIQSPDFSMPPPIFERPRPIPKTQKLRQGFPPMPKVPTPAPAPAPPPMPRTLKEGPIPMPTGSFKDLSFEKPKKGLFGRFKK